MSSDEPTKKPMCGFCYTEKEVHQLKYCANCEEVRYCSRECQVAHWKGGHRFQCHRKTCQTKEKMINFQSHESCPIKQGHDEESCPICMETLLISSNLRVILPCQHAFHRSCVEGLRAHGVAQVCPICRAKLPPSAAKVRESATMRYFNVERRVLRGECTWDTLCPEGIRELRKVAKEWQIAADDGDVLAQLCLGNKYMSGMGVALSPNVDLAEKYLSLASDQGNPQAQFNLGTIYYQKAQEEYMKHNAHIQCSTSQTTQSSSSECQKNEQENNYDNDMNDDPHPRSDDSPNTTPSPVPYFSPEFNAYKDRVYRLWSLAAEQDDPNALYNLAMMYKRGCVDNAIPDIPKSLYLLRRAAEMGHDKANATIECIRNEMNI